MKRAQSVFGFFLLGGAAAFGAEAPAPPALAFDSFTLANGMEFVVVDRPGTTTVSAGWVARVGSVDETPGATGLTHLLEHMLFKGSRTIGARDLPRELQAMEREDRLQAELREAHGRQRERFRAGEVSDPYAPDERPPELKALEGRARRAASEAAELSEAGAFQRTYSEAGATQLNGVTMADLTLFFVTVPANKLELWFWMESDRLLAPVLRGFYTERMVVTEERRQRVEGTPTGSFAEQLEALFWLSHPYRTPTSGWPADLGLLARADAERHFETHYGPGNLTAVLVGELDAGEVRAWAERYFGRLEPRPAPPEVAAIEPAVVAERRMLARCECRPQVEALFHTVPFAHPDGPVLEVLAGLLNGRTGRLHRSLVLEQEVAFSASATQESRRWAGLFTLTAEAAGEATAEDLLAALEREVAALAARPVPEAELAKVKNQVLADAYRRLEEPQGLLRQLLIHAGLGDWRGLEARTAATLKVSAEDVRRAAARYLRPEQRTAGLYARSGSGDGR